MAEKSRSLVDLKGDKASVPRQSSQSNLAEGSKHGDQEPNLLPLAHSFLRQSGDSVSAAVTSGTSTSGMGDTNPDENAAFSKYVSTHFSKHLKQKYLQEQAENEMKLAAGTTLPDEYMSQHSSGSHSKKRISQARSTCSSAFVTQADDSDTQSEFSVARSTPRSAPVSTPRGLQKSSPSERVFRPDIRGIISGIEEIIGEGKMISRIEEVSDVPSIGAVGDFKENKTQDKNLPRTVDGKISAAEREIHSNFTKTYGRKHGPLPEKTNICPSTEESESDYEETDTDSASITTASDFSEKSQSSKCAESEINKHVSDQSSNSFESSGIRNWTPNHRYLSQIHLEKASQHVAKQQSPDVELQAKWMTLKNNSQSDTAKGDTSKHSKTQGSAKGEKKPRSYHNERYKYSNHQDYRTASLDTDDISEQVRTQHEKKCCPSTLYDKYSSTKVAPIVSKNEPTPSSSRSVTKENVSRPWSSLSSSSCVAKESQPRSSQPSQASQCSDRGIIQTKVFKNHAVDQQVQWYPK